MTSRAVAALDVRLAIPAAVAWAVIAVLVGAPAVATGAAIALWVGAGAAAVAIRRVGALGLVALACAGAALGATSIALQTPARSPAAFVAAEADRAAIPVVVEATETVRPNARSWSALAVDADGEDVRVAVIVVGEPVERRIEVGERLSVPARVAATEPGEDRAWLLFADETPRTIAPPAPGLAWAGELRARFSRIASALPGPGGDLLPGLAIGDTTAVEPALDSAMTDSSLSHLTAVSGSNCAIVVALAMLVGRALGVPRAARIAGAIALLGAFVVLVTPEPSVQRAAVMAAIVILLLAAGRPLRGLPVLALAVLGLLIADPWLSRSAGFALSVLATAGLLVLAPPLVRTLERALPRAIALVVAIPVAAQLACQPVLVALDPVLAPYGVLANLLAAPAAPVATVLGLVACVLAPVAPPLASVIAALAWVPSAWIAAVAHVISSLPGARVPWPPGPVGVGLIAALTVMGVVVLVAARRTRRIASAALALGLVVLMGVAVGSQVASTVGRPADWQFAMCDVGQGDALVVRSGAAVGLVDTGPDPARLEACLDAIGVGRVDLVVLTHYDLDHVGGWEAIRGRTDLVIVGPTDGVEDETILTSLAGAGARIVHVRRGDEGALGEWRWRVEWPPVGPIDPGNDASVTIRLEAMGECSRGCLSALLLGDLGAEPQARLRALGVSPVDVVKVSHHGSADQDAELYARVSAAVGLIGVGEGNGYGHPTDEALALLERAGTGAWRTDRCGLVLVAPGDGSGARVWTERAGCGAERDDGVGGRG